MHVIALLFCPESSVTMMLFAHLFLLLLLWLLFVLPVTIMLLP